MTIMNAPFWVYGCAVRKKSTHVSEKRTASISGVEKQA
jgi:hypothetical protein